MPRRRAQEGLEVEGLMAMGQSQVCCGTCCHFSAASGLGDCNVLRKGSDIASDPPVFVLKVGGKFDTEPIADASKCKHYEGKKGISLSC